jgi:transposase
LTSGNSLIPSQKNDNLSVRIQKRCQIVALSKSCIAPSSVTWFVNCNISTVHRWIKQIKNDGNLCDRKRSGRPLVYDENIQLKTTAFYCQVSPLPGCNTWSLRWAEQYLINHSDILGCSMSHSTIQRILKNHALRPHLHKYFLSITDPNFFPKMDHIIALYLNQPEYLFNFDESTGLQAKSPLCPGLPAGPDKKRYEEFEYKRNGTTDLMAFLNPKTGKVFGKCTTNHNTQTLISVFKEHVNSLPADAQIHYIMDNLNTHFHNDFCYTVAELSNLTYKPLKTGLERRQWLQSDKKRIVIHFLPFHGSWLNMIEIWFGILSKKCLKHQAFQSVAHLQEIIEQFIETWNNFYAHPFTWKYTGQGLHEKSVSRFNKLLLIESKQMDISFLTKQLLLMSNIAQTYNKILQSSQWEKLKELLFEKKDYINSIIYNSSKTKQVTKVENALNDLSSLFTWTDDDNLLLNMNILNCQNM